MSFKNERKSSSPAKFLKRKFDAFYFYDVSKEKIHKCRNFHKFSIIMKALEQFFHFCIACWSLAGIGAIN